MFKVLPNAFIRIKFRCIGWKLLEMNLFCPTVGQKGFHLVRAMDTGAVPDQPKAGGRDTQGEEADRLSFPAPSARGGELVCTSARWAVCNSRLRKCRQVG